MSGHARPVDVIVVGAGLAGLTAAQRLRHAGLRVRVVEKARGPGGRMSTRRIDALRFDHGAQYFTARDARFQVAAQAWQAAGLIAPWAPRLAVIDAQGHAPKASSPRRWVGMPGMSAVCRHLAQALTRDCQFDWRAGAVEELPGGRWRVHAAEHEDSAEAMVEGRALLITAPAPQALALLAPWCPPDAPLRDIVLDPCWAVMTTFDRPLLPEYDAAFVNTGPLSWIAAQRSRPGRPAQEAWVLHGGPTWSAAHLELAPDDAAQSLLEAALALPGADRRAAPAMVKAHRWRHSVARAPLEEGVDVLLPGRLIAAGDWACGSRVEGAWQSGRAAAAHLIEHLGRGGERA